MGEMRRIGVDLNAKEVDLVDRLLAEQRFSNNGEIFRYAMMLLQDWIDEQDQGDRVLAENYTPEEIRRLWDEGIASGPPIAGNFDAEDIQRRGLARLRECGKRKRAQPDHARAPIAARLGGS